MRINELVTEKIRLLSSNTRMPLYWSYKFANFFKKNALNNGERYDPNILKRFNINDPDHAARYHFADSIISYNDSILDIACGTGYGTAILADKRHEVVGVDVSNEAIRFAEGHYKKVAEVRYIRSDIFDYESTADVVVSFETIEHIGKDVGEVVLRLLRLATKKLICSVPFKEKAGFNHFHVHFDLDESSFAFILKEYDVRFLYQTKDGVIHNSDIGDTLNLLIIIDKHNGR